jgi:hypothetical protein
MSQPKELYSIAERFSIIEGETTASCDKLLHELLLRLFGERMREEPAAASRKKMETPPSPPKNKANHRLVLYKSCVSVYSYLLLLLGTDNIIYIRERNLHT